MTRDDIIRMAREAGFYSSSSGRVESPYVESTCLLSILESFATLVAAAEREACAQVCESVGGMSGDYWTDKCAEAIRARSTI